MNQQKESNKVILKQLKLIRKNLEVLAYEVRLLVVNNLLVEPPDNSGKFELRTPKPKLKNINRRAYIG